MIAAGQKVALDTIDARDLGLLRVYRNDYAIWRWCRQNGLISPQNQSAWFERIQQDPTIQMFAIKAEPMDEDWATVGVCGLTSIDMANRRAEFSLYIASAYQGRGYARAALKTLLHHGFMNLGLNSIWGESFEGNPAMKLFESLGFQKEGIRRQFYFKEGKFIDAHLFSILRSEWDAKNAG